jgi:hypothetical protein
MRYEPSGINFHLGETPPREPQGGGEHTECVAELIPINGIGLGLHLRRHADS